MFFVFARPTITPACLFDHTRPEPIIVFAIRFGHCFYLIYWVGIVLNVCAKCHVGANWEKTQKKSSSAVNKNDGIELRQLVIQVSVKLYPRFVTEAAYYREPVKTTQVGFSVRRQSPGFPLLSNQVKLPLITLAGSCCFPFRIDIARTWPLRVAL